MLSQPGPLAPPPRPQTCKCRIPHRLARPGTGRVLPFMATLPLHQVCINVVMITACALCPSERLDWARRRATLVRHCQPSHHHGNPRDIRSGWHVLCLPILRQTAPDPARIHDGEEPACCSHARGQHVGSRPAHGHPRPWNCRRRHHGEVKCDRLDVSYACGGNFVSIWAKELAQLARPHDAAAEEAKTDIETKGSAYVGCDASSGVVTCIASYVTAASESSSSAVRLVVLKRPNAHYSSTRHDLSDLRLQGDSESQARVTPGFLFFCCRSCSADVSILLRCLVVLVSCPGQRAPLGLGQPGVLPSCHVVAGHGEVCLCSSIA